MSFIYHIGSWLGALTLFATVSASLISRPGEIHSCVGHDVSFNWTYDNNTDHVSMKFWQFLGTGLTMVAWYDNGQIKYYGNYTNRVTLLEDSNAGVVLKNVTEADTGEYRVELAGPGYRDVAELYVHNASGLRPIISLDNIVITPNDNINMTSNGGTAVALTTSYLIPANITIYVKGQEDVTCDQITSCNRTVLIPGGSTRVISVAILVDYGICELGVMNYTFNIITRGSAIAGKPKGTRIGIGVLAAFICSILFFVFIYVKGGFHPIRSKRKETSTQSDEPRERTNERDTRSLESYDNISMDEVNETNTDVRNYSSEKINNKNKTNEEKQLLKTDAVVNLNTGVPMDMTC